MMDELELAGVDELIASVSGRTILGGSLGEGGMHLEMDDGRYLVIIGLVAVVRVEKASLQ